MVTQNEDGHVLGQPRRCTFCGFFLNFGLGTVMTFIDILFVGIHVCHLL